MNLQQVANQGYRESIGMFRVLYVFFLYVDHRFLGRQFRKNVLFFTQKVAEGI